MNVPISPIPLDKAYRLLNHGPTVLVSARHDGVDNVMAAAWCCALDLAPTKLTVVLDKLSATRALVERSGVFVIQILTVALLDVTKAVGSVSLSEDADKLAHCGVELFEMEGCALPLVAGCSAWLAGLPPHPRAAQRTGLRPFHRRGDGSLGGRPRVPRRPLAFRRR